MDTVEITAQDVRLPGRLVIPSQARGIVVFAHGSGSGINSPRNNKVAEDLRRRGLGTLLLDLLTPIEGLEEDKVFDIGLLAERLMYATQWLRGHPAIRKMEIGYFGASTGAAAALVAAAKLGDEIAAVVSRGGRPDLARHRLVEVRCPTLLIVGGDDLHVLKLNQEVLPLIEHSDLIVIPGASHLFEEPGTLDLVSDHAARFFTKQFRERQRPSGSHREAAS